MPIRPAALASRKPLLALAAAGALACSALALGVALPPAAEAAGERGKVELIMSNLPPAESAAYRKIRSAAGKATGQKLDLTRCEVWVVDAGRVEAIRKEAEARGVGVRRLGEGWNHLLGKLPAQTPMSPRQSEMMSMAAQSPATASVGMMEAPPPNMVEYALTKGMTKDGPGAPMSIVIPLDERTSVTVQRTSVTKLPDKCIWRGLIEETGETVTLMWWPGGRMSGTVHYKGMMYTVKNMGGGTHAVVGMKPEMMPDEHGPMKPMRRDDPNLRDDPLYRTGDGGMMRPRQTPEPAVPVARRQPSKTEIRNAQDAASTARASMSRRKGGGLIQTPATAGPPQKPVEIAVMVAYTRKAARHYADIRTDLIELAVEEANQTFRNSGVGHISLKLVHTHATDYDETGGIHFDHVWRMADRGDGHMEEIPLLRNQKKADVVVLIVDDPSGCGLATRVAADAEEAFAVAHHECAATTYTLAHEVGHIIGARHDISLDQNTTPFPYGHGYVNGLEWRTMMSYKGSCNGCPRMPVWSNPAVRIKGKAAGTDMANNARVLSEQAERVARFRQ
jgi:hypothetical protein